MTHDAATRALGPVQGGRDANARRAIARDSSSASSPSSTTRSRPALVVVCEQSDDGCRFNRGQCLNAAYAIATSTFSERIDRCGTHFACHDVDMAPEAATKTAYFVEDDARDGAGFVRVLEASGCRYDAEKCFGGVTIYDVTAFERTNGYPNGFYGWGGEDHAAFLRAAEAGVRVERRSGAAFDDLEKDVETVAKKLITARRTRCSNKRQGEGASAETKRKVLARRRLEFVRIRRRREKRAARIAGVDVRAVQG